jgi:hypothetical protein
MSAQLHSFNLVGWVQNSSLYGENPAHPWRYPSRNGDREVTRGMVVSVWSGREARALRIGLA